MQQICEGYIGDTYVRKPAKRYITSSEAANYDPQPAAHDSTCCIAPVCYQNRIISGVRDLDKEQDNSTYLRADDIPQIG